MSIFNDPLQQQAFNLLNPTSSANNSSLLQQNPFDFFSQVDAIREQNALDTIAQQQRSQEELTRKKRSPREGFVNFLNLLSDTGLRLQGQDPATFKAAQEKLLRDAEDENRRRELIASLPPPQRDLVLLFGDQALDRIYPTTQERKIIKGADGFNYFADTGERVLPDVKGKPTTDSSTRFSILDNGKQIGTILRSDIEGIREAESKGFQIANLASPTTRPTGKNTIFDDLLTQHKATNKIISTTQGLANKFAEDPASALAVGGVAQFVDSVVQNIDQVGNFLKDTDNEAFQSATQGLSVEGTDFNTRIQEISQRTGVTESRIRDLAYLFAAARGQTGRGLSDKDYENALRIVSGGVGARGRTAVLEDVANRLSEELMMDINYITKTNPDNQNLINQINNLPDINTFINPFTQVQPQTGGSDPLGIR